MDNNLNYFFCQNKMETKKARIVDMDVASLGGKIDDKGEGQIKIRVGTTVLS